MNPYLKKFQYGGKGDPEDPITELLNYNLTQPNKQPIYGLGANPYQQASGYSWGSGMPNKPTEVVNTTGSGHSQTMPSPNTPFQGNYDPRMPGEKALQAVDKTIGQYVVQPAMELYNTPFALAAEGVDALQGKEASLERALPNPTRMALNAQGIQSDIPNQQFLSDYVGVDREKNPYLALGLDILTPGPAMFAKIGKAILPKSSKFQSEIDWSKWNKEIPSNKKLLNEYKLIEQSTKADGTWMKNADGSAYQGIPEQFVQENSSNFKKAFPWGFGKTYRGSQFLSLRFDKTANQNKDIITFGTSDESVAKRYSTNNPVNFNDEYQDVGKDVSYWHPDIDVEKLYEGWSSNAKPGMYEILYPTGQKTINAEGLGNRWFNIKQDDVFESIKQNNYQDFRQGHDYRNYFNSSHPMYMGNEMTYGNVATDDMAQYMIKNDISVGKVSNVYDGKDYFGNPKPANVTMLNTSILPVKSRWYNNGMFDMTNRNIFKGLAPYFLGTGAATYGVNEMTQQAQQNRYGGQNPYMKTYGKGGDTKTSDEEVNCTNCGWSWKLSEGGDDPYMCHECNHDNSQEYKKTANKQQYEKGGDTELSTVEIERSERVYTPNGKLIMETPANAPTHEEGGVKVTLPGGSLVFPKKYYKSLDAASGLPAFKKITNTMLDNAEKAYLRGEAYSSGGKRKQ